MTQSLRWGALLGAAFILLSICEHSQSTTANSMVLPTIDDHTKKDARPALVDLSSLGQEQVEVEITRRAGNRDMPIVDISRQCGKVAIDDKVQVSLIDACRKAFPAEAGDSPGSCVYVGHRFESERNPADKERICRYDQNARWGVPRPNTLLVTYHLESHPDCVRETDDSLTGPDSLLKLRIFITVKKGP